MGVGVPRTPGQESTEGVHLHCLSMTRGADCKLEQERPAQLAGHLWVRGSRGESLMLSGEAAKPALPAHHHPRPCPAGPLHTQGPTWSPSPFGRPGDPQAPPAIVSAGTSQVPFIPADLHS